MSTGTDTEYVWARRMTQLVRQHDKDIARLDVELAEMRDALVNMSDHLDKLKREQLKASMAAVVPPVTDAVAKHSV